MFRLKGNSKLILLYVTIILKMKYLQEMKVTVVKFTVFFTTTNF